MKLNPNYDTGDQELATPLVTDKPLVYMKCRDCGRYHRKGVFSEGFSGDAGEKLGLIKHCHRDCISMDAIDALRDRLAAAGSRQPIIVETAL